MAIDTAQKRGSSLGFDALDGVLPFPAGTPSQENRQQLLRSYSGILAIEATTWTQQPRSQDDWTQQPRASGIWTQQARKT